MPILTIFCGQCWLFLSSLNGLYFFSGVYADDGDLKILREKYQDLTIPQLKESKEFYADILEQDISMTVRLQIVYSRLSIRSVRSAFEESVGNRLRKFNGGSDNADLLKR